MWSTRGVCSYALSVCQVIFCTKIIYGSGENKEIKFYIIAKSFNFWIFVFIENTLKWIPNDIPNVGVYSGSDEGCVRVDIGGIYRIKLRLEFKPKMCDGSIGNSNIIDAPHLFILKNSSQTPQLRVLRSVVSSYSAKVEELKTVELRRHLLEVNAWDQVCLLVLNKSCLYLERVSVLDISLKYAQRNGTYNSFN